MQQRASALAVRAVHRVGWSRIRIGLAAVYFTLLAVRLLSGGVPTNRRELAVVVVTGLAVWCVGRGWRQLLQVVLDWLPFTALLMLYDASRAFAGRVGMPLHEADIARLERWLFGGVVPTVWLQQHLYDPGRLHWYDALASLVYISHFVVTPLLAAILWMIARRQFLRFAGRVLLLSFAGLVTYVVFPEAPPWMAARDGYLPPVARLSARGWQYLHAGFADHLLARGQNSGANPIAAMPSLHLAFAMLAALFVAGRLRSRWRVLLFLYPVLMGATLVYTGEHYVLDLVAGALYAVGTHRFVTVLERRWRAHQPPPTLARPPVAPGAGHDDLPVTPVTAEV